MLATGGTIAMKIDPEKNAPVPAISGEDLLAIAPEVSGVIVSHGTDTLEETAFWLDTTVDSEKPIVMIGAQRNASSSDFDGPRHLLNSVRIATDEVAQNKGAMLAMNNQINAD